MKQELKKKIKELEIYLTSPKPAPSNKIVDTYNEFKGPDPKTGRIQEYTSCGSCLRRMLKEMVNVVHKEEEKQKERTKKAREAKKEKKKEEDV